MSRPTTKPDLIRGATEQFDKMWHLIHSMSDDALDANFEFSDALNQKEAHWKRDKNVRDVLIHLYEWHQLLLNWIKANQSGEKKPFIPAPYNWKTYGQMNVAFWEKHQHTPLTKSFEMLKNSHKDVVLMIDSFSNDELFAKGKLPWTETSTLGSYCASATSSHYDWAIKKIKLHSKTARESQKG